MRIPILTYHASNVDGSEYGHNDLVCLEQDLARLHRAGWQVIPLRQVVAALAGQGAERLPERALAITLDDGTDFDYHDLPHPTHGAQQGVLGILARHRDGLPANLAKLVVATSFVIASPLARRDIEQGCLAGLPWVNDDWWAQARESGLMRIENHSWDHNHEVLTGQSMDCGTRGSFAGIDNQARADYQVRQATNYINQRLGQAAVRHFAYPYGDASDYLMAEYLPQHGPDQGLEAAFTTVPEPVTEGSDRWAMPRYVCRRDWQQPEQLDRLLADTGA